MTRHSLLIALLCIATGCVRLVSPAQDTDTPSKASIPNGSACASAPSCISGSCVEGVCCQHACQATESCALPDSRGTCTLRPRGASCTSAADCPTGFCAHGVCCNSACGEACQQCDAPGHEGTCTVADNNRDPHGSCQGPCEACFGGRCGPALVGTNPKESVDGGTACPPLQACNADGECGAAVGQACTVDLNGGYLADNCATHACFADTCVQPRVEAVPVTVGNPRAQVRQLMNMALAAPALPFLLFREEELDASPTQPGGSGRYRFATVRKGLTLAFRDRGTWAGWTLADLVADDDTGGDALSERFFHLLQLRASPPGVTFFSHIPDRPVVNGGSPRLAAALGSSACALLATWFYPDVGAGGRRCLLRSITNSRGEDATLLWYSVEFLEATRLALVTSTSSASGPELSLHDCPAGACQVGKVLSTDDAGAFSPGLMVVESGRPLVFHFPDPADRLLAVDGNTTAEVSLMPACALGQPYVDGIPPYNADHPGRSLSGARVVVNGHVRWLLSFMCGHDAGLAYYDPANRVFDGPVKAVTVPSGDVVASAPFSLPDGRPGVLLGQEYIADVSWERADGTRRLQRLVDFGPSGTGVRGVWAGALGDGMPLLAWDAPFEDNVDLPGVPVGLRPVRRQSTIFVQLNTP